jgi:hypothetical protein
MGKKSRSGSGMIIPDHISESLETINNHLGENPDQDPRTFLTWDPGWKNLDPDLQH